MAKGKRIKKGVELQSRRAFESAVDRIAELDTERRLLEAQRDEEIQIVQERHNARILAVKDEQDCLLDLAEDYAADHRDELFPKGRQTAETRLAEYGFRKHPVTLALLSRKWKWEAVLDLLRAWRPEFIRNKEEPDKDAIKAQLTEVELEELGLKLVQKESFGVTPKTEAGERGVA